MAGQLWYAIVDYPLSQVIENDSNITQNNKTVSNISNDKSKCIISFPANYAFTHKNYAIFNNSNSLLEFQLKDPKNWDEDAIVEEKIDEEGRRVITPAPFSETGGFFFRGTGFKSIANKSEDGIQPKTTNLDFELFEDRYINGVRMILKNHTFEDSVYFEIIDKEFYFAGTLYPATPYEAGVPVPENIPWSAIMPDGMILNRFGKDWQLSEESDQGRELLKYPAKIFSQMTIRIVFKTYSTEDVIVKCNLYLHEKKRDKLANMGGIFNEKNNSRVF